VFLAFKKYQYLQKYLMQDLALFFYRDNFFYNANGKSITLYQSNCVSIYQCFIFNENVLLHIEALWIINF
jgi:hypothetical protein